MQTNIFSLLHACFLHHHSYYDHHHYHHYHIPWSSYITSLKFSWVYLLLAKTRYLQVTHQGIWQDAERNSKLRRNLRSYYAEYSVNYSVKITNYAVVLEQMTRKNRSITVHGKNSKLHGRLNNYKTFPKEIFSHHYSCSYQYVLCLWSSTIYDEIRWRSITFWNKIAPFFPQHPGFCFFKCPSEFLSTLLSS